MLVPMTQLQVIGQRHALDGSLAALQTLRAAEVVVRPPADGEPADGVAEAAVEEQATIEALLRRLEPCSRWRRPPPRRPRTGRRRRPQPHCCSLTPRGLRRVRSPGWSS